jgi:2-hydroxychromene-2-carboxylate isomerase
VRDRIQRRLLPRIILGLFALDLRGRLARLTRLAGRPGRVELFVAFDDPQSAVALIGLATRMQRRAVRLAVVPVVARGIPGDPAVEDKRGYAVLDARRLLARDRLTLSRRTALRPETTAFLADWTSTLSDDTQRSAFALAAMRKLWLETDGAVEPAAYVALWHETTGSAPPASAAGASGAGERLMKRRRLYDTPVAVVHGQWFFAHERLPAIEQRLDRLGWSST